MAESELLQRVRIAIAKLSHFKPRTHVDPKLSWAECKQRLVGLFSTYDTPEQVKSAFFIPGDYDIFMENGGGLLSDGYFDFCSADGVFGDTKYYAELYGDPNFSVLPDISPVRGYWLPVGCADHKFMNYLCCDNTLPYFGTIHRGDDDHPQHRNQPSCDHETFIDLLEWIGVHGEDK